MFRIATSQGSRPLRASDDDGAIDAAIRAEGPGDRVVWDGPRIVAVICRSGSPGPDVICPTGNPGD